MSDATETVATLNANTDKSVFMVLIMVFLKLELKRKAVRKI